MARARFTSQSPILPRHLNHLQESMLGALRQLRLALGTSCILYGLTVESASGGAVQVAPGLAFDGEGSALELEAPLRVTLPSGAGPHFLVMVGRVVVDESSNEGEALLESDSVEFRWLAKEPTDAEIVLLAHVRRTPAGRVIVDDRMARRAAPLDHRHTATLQSDPQGRVRWDGLAVSPHEPVLQPADLDLALERLRSEMLGQIASLTSRLSALENQSPQTPRESKAESPDDDWVGDLELLPGVGDKIAKALAESGVRSVSDLLRAAATRAGRQQLSRDSGISTGRLETFARLADFLRLHSVTPEYAKLLYDAGIASVQELATSDPATIAEKFREVFDPEAYNAKKPPRLALIKAWVQEAGRLPRIVIE